MRYLIYFAVSTSDCRTGDIAHQHRAADTLSAIKTAGYSNAVRAII